MEATFGIVCTKAKTNINVQKPKQQMHRFVTGRLQNDVSMGQKISDILELSRLAGVPEINK